MSTTNMLEQQVYSRSKLEIAVLAGIALAFVAVLGLVVVGATAGPLHSSPVNVVHAEGESMTTHDQLLVLEDVTRPEIGDRVVWDNGHGAHPHHRIVDYESGEGWITQGDTNAAVDQPYANHATVENTYGSVAFAIPLSWITAIAGVLAGVWLFVLALLGWRHRGRLPSLGGSVRRDQVATSVVVVLLVASVVPSGALAVSSANSGSDVSLTTGDLEERSAGEPLVIVGSNDGNVYAFNADTGDEVWSFSTNGAAGHSSPTVSNGVVYVGDDAGYMYAIDLSNGQEIWNFSTPVSSPVKTGAVVKDNRVYFGNGHTYSLYTENGTLDWEYNDGGQHQAPDVSNGTVYIGDYNQDFHVIDAETGEGSVLANDGAYHRGSVAYRNGLIYTQTDAIGGGSSGSVGAIYEENGTKNWTGGDGNIGDASLTLTNDSVLAGSYSTTSESYVWSFDAETGEQEWRYTAPNYVDSTPTVSNGIVYFGNYNSPEIIALDEDTGNEVWTHTTGDSVTTSSPTVYGGTLYIGSGTDLYALDSGTGDVQWNTTTGDTVASSPAIVPSGADSNLGSRNELQTHGYHEGSASTGSSINGTVTDQNGNPVQNATVRLTAVNYDNIVPDGVQSAEDRANELLQEAGDPLPDAWNPELALSGSSGVMTGEQNYVAIHTEADIGATAWTDSADLEPTLRAPSGEPVVFTVWDPTEGGRLFGQHEYDSQLPGQHRNPDEPVTVEQLDPRGDTVRTIKVDIDQRAGGGFGDPDTLAYGSAQLSAGFYRVSAPNSNLQYTIVVGDPNELRQTITQDLTNQADQLTEYAEEQRQRFQNNKFETLRTTTGPNGEFSVSVPSSLQTAHVIAYEVPDGLNPETADPGDIREVYNTQLIERVGTSASGIPELDVSYTTDPSQIANITDEFNRSSPLPSFSLPSQTRTVSPPANVTLTVQSADVPSFASPNVTANQTEWLKDLLANRTQRLTELFDQFNATSDELEGLYEEYGNLTEQNEKLKNRVEEILNRSGIDRETIYVDNPSDLDKEQLQERLDAMQQALVEVRDTIPTEDIVSEVGAETVGTTATFPGELLSDQITVLARYSNGTTRPVPDEYVTVEQSAASGLFGSDIGSTTVTVSEFPLGDAASAQLVTRVVNADGVGTAKQTVDNPLVAAQPPNVPSVQISNLAPGPSERITMSMNPADDAPFNQIENVEVRGPNGMLNATVTDSDSVGFTADGSGVHTARITFSDTDGQQYVRTVRVRAEQQSQSQPPSIKAASDAMGEYAIVSNGFEQGRVETSGGDVTLVAQLAQDADAPSTVHAYLADADVEPNGATEVRVVRGDSEESVRKHLSVVLHSKNLPEGSNVYRGDPPSLGLGFPSASPITAAGSDAGELTSRENGATIRTYTDADGSATIHISATPGLGERAALFIANLVPDVNIPVVGQTMPLPGSMGDLAPEPAAYALPVPALGLLACRSRGGNS